MTQFWSIQGQVPYRFAHQLMSEMVEARSRELIPDTVLFLEHTPVLTEGAKEEGTEFSPRSLAVLPSEPVRMEFAAVERTGGRAFHGPGQLMIYPILKCDGRGLAPKRDRIGFVRMLEQWVIDEVAWWGAVAHRCEGKDGVWVGQKRIANIGVAFRRGVSFHGIGLNVLSSAVLADDLEGVALENISSVRVAPNWRYRIEERLARTLGGRTLQASSLPGLVRRFNFRDTPQSIPAQKVGLVRDLGTVAVSAPVKSDLNA